MASVCTRPAKRARGPSQENTGGDGFLDVNFARHQFSLNADLA